MTTLDSFRWTSRGAAADALLAHLRATPASLPIRGQPHRETVARLLAVVACAEHEGALRELALDAAEDGWVRRDALRGLLRLGAELSPSELERLLAEGPHHDDRLLLLLAFATGPARQEVALRHLDEAGPASEDELLLNARLWHALELPEPLLAALHGRWLERVGEAPERDASVAFATWDRPGSADVALGARGPLDLRRLSSVAQDATAEQLAAWFERFPDRLEEALDGLALPLEAMKIWRSQAELSRRAVELLAEARAGESGRLPRLACCALRVLEELADEEALERLRALPELDGQLERPLGHALLRLRARPTAGWASSVAPDDAEAVAQLAALLREVSAAPSGEDEPLLRWALGAWHGGLRSRAIGGLERLGALDEATLAALAGDDDPRARLRALGALAARGDSEATSRLRQAAVEAPGVCERAEALRWLARVDARASGALLRALSRDHEVFDGWYAAAAEEAALALAREGSPPALEALLRGALELRVDDSRAFVEHALERVLDGDLLDQRSELTWRWLWLARP